MTGFGKNFDLANNLTIMDFVYVFKEIGGCVVRREQKISVMNLLMLICFIQRNEIVVVGNE